MNSHTIALALGACGLIGLVLSSLPRPKDATEPAWPRIVLGMLHGLAMMALAMAAMIPGWTLWAISLLVPLAVIPLALERLAARRRLRRRTIRAGYASDA